MGFSSSNTAREDLAQEHREKEEHLRQKEGAERRRAMRNSKLADEVAKIDANFLGTVMADEARFGDVHAKVLAEALKNNYSVTDVHLDNNKIGDDGMNVVAEILKYNEQITCLTINGNKIGDLGAQVLAEALKLKSTRQWVELKNNIIGDAGTQALAEMMKSNRTTRNLWVIKELSDKAKGELTEGAGQRVEVYFD